MLNIFSIFLDNLLFKHREKTSSMESLCLGITFENLKEGKLQFSKYLLILFETT